MELGHTVPIPMQPAPRMHHTLLCQVPGGTFGGGGTVLKTIINLIRFYYIRCCISHLPSQALLMTCYGFVRGVALIKLPQYAVILGGISPGVST